MVVVSHRYRKIYRFLSSTLSYLLYNNHDGNISFFLQMRNKLIEAYAFGQEIVLEVFFLQVQCIATHHTGC